MSLKVTTPQQFIKHFTRKVRKQPFFEFATLLVIVYGPFMKNNNFCADYGDYTDLHFQSH
jgi:hypothetical protein